MSLSQSTMLAAIYLGLPRQGRQLKDKAKAIESEAKAEGGTVGPPSSRYFRKKYKDEKGHTKESDGLQILKDLQNEYKARIRALARYPYTGDLYYAPAAVVEDLLKLKHLYEEQNRKEVWTQWENNVYPEWAKEAPERMGDLYDPNDYPSLIDCAKRFKMEMVLIPMAEKDQVAQVTLISPQSKQLLMTYADAKQKKTIAELHGQIWKDLMQPLQHIVTTFNKDKTKISKSLLGNLMQVVSIVPAYGELCGDPTLLQAAAEAKAVFEKITIEDLRGSAEVQHQAKTQAELLITTFEP